MDPDARRDRTPATTVGSVLQDATWTLRASGSESARLDAELLLGHVVGVDRTTLLAHPEAMLGSGARASFEALLERRARGEPVAYIRGIKEFHGVALTVDPRALIPRPETEVLVDLAIAWIRERLTSAPRPPGSRPLVAWDVGTGSGAIAVSLAVALRALGFAGEVRVHASDASADVLALALENAVGHGVADLVTFAVGDLLDATPAPDAVDLVVANLPYIPSDAVDRLPVAASFEPRMALDGGPDGLSVIRRLLPALPSALASSGQALLEIGAEQGPAMRVLAAEHLPGWWLDLRDDLSGRPRVVRLSGPA